MLLLAQLLQFVLQRSINNVLLTLMPTHFLKKDTLPSLSHYFFYFFILIDIIMLSLITLIK